MTDLKKTLAQNYLLYIFQVTCELLTIHTVHLRGAASDTISVTHWQAISAKKKPSVTDPPQQKNIFFADVGGCDVYSRAGPLVRVCQVRGNARPRMGPAIILAVEEDSLFSFLLPKNETARPGVGFLPSNSTRTEPGLTDGDNYTCFH